LNDEDFSLVRRVSTTAAHGYRGAQPAPARICVDVEGEAVALANVFDRNNGLFPRQELEFIGHCAPQTARPASITPVGRDNFMTALTVISEPTGPAPTMRRWSSRPGSSNTDSFCRSANANLAPLTYNRSHETVEVIHGFLNVIKTARSE
jgi:hypothetical protein